MAERMYPGLGTPIESGLPFDVGPGTRAAGMQMLGQAMDPNVRRIPSIGEVLFGMGPYQSLGEKIAEQRNKMEQDYYSVPSTPSAGVPDPAGIAYNLAAMRPDNRLGPSASGRAEPALLTDEMVKQYGAARFGGIMFPWIRARPDRRTGQTETSGSTYPPGPKEMRGEGNFPTFGMTPGAGPQKQTGAEIMRQETVEKGREPSAEASIPIPAPRGLPSDRFTVQGINPPPGYGMPNYQGMYPNVILPGMRTPFAF